MADRGRQILLGVLVAVAALVAYQTWPRTSDDPTPASTGSRAEGSKRERATPTPAAAPEVHLQALQAPRPKPLSLDRNLFRFKPKPAPLPPVVQAPVLPPPAPIEPPPPRLPPIPYRFLGIVEAPDRSLVIAVLTDGRTTVHGRVGDLVEGRYRIVRISPDSIEMAYADGRGRQTIRLTGS